MEDARKEAGRWFCSPSCLLQGSPGTWKNEKRRGPVRRFVKWTLVIVALLVVALIMGAILGVGKTTPAKKTSAPQQVAARSTGPGSRSKPIRLGHTAGIGGGWQMRVVSVKPNANKEVLAANPSYDRRLPPHAQDYMVAIAVKYKGGGQSGFGVLGGLHAVGAHKAVYTLTSGLNGCGPGESKLPPPDLQDKNLDNVFSGTSATGHICFQIASNDAKTLKLYYEWTTYSGLTAHAHRLWFALR